MTLAQPTLHTARLQVAPVEPLVAQALLDYQIKNRAHLKPWDPTPGELFFTLPFWTGRCRLRAREWQEGRTAAFVLLHREHPGRVIGSLSLSNLQRGVMQGATLGYSIDADFQGQGLMFEALTAVIDFAFSVLRLHRIQANYQPHNQRSAALLARLGFVVEGCARDYLFLDGAWRDHVMSALLNPDFDPTGLPM